MKVGLSGSCKCFSFDLGKFFFIFPKMLCQYSSERSILDVVSFVLISASLLRFGESQTFLLLFSCPFLLVY